MQVAYSAVPSHQPLKITKEQPVAEVHPNCDSGELPKAEPGQSTYSRFEPQEDSDFLDCPRPWGLCVLLAAFCQLQFSCSFMGFTWALLSETKLRLKAAKHRQQARKGCPASHPDFSKLHRGEKLPQTFRLMLQSTPKCKTHKVKVPTGYCPQKEDVSVCLGGGS